MKTIGWKKSLFGHQWKSNQGTKITIYDKDRNYYVIINRESKYLKSKPFTSQKQAINYAVDYMRQHPEDNSFIAKNIIVSLDFDGVLAHGLDIKKKYAKEWFGMHLHLEQTKKDGFEKLVKETRRKNINYRSLMDPLNEKHIMEYKIPHDCIKVLTQLHKEGFRFVIITSRNDHDYPYAKKFVSHHFGHIIKNIYNTRNKSKDEFVKKLKPRIHMDDGYKKLLEIQDNPIHCLFYRQPENFHVSQNKFKEIQSWKEFYNECHRIKSLHEVICKKYNIENNYHNISKIFEEE